MSNQTPQHTQGPWVFHTGDVVNAPSIKSGKLGICLLQQNAHPEIRDANAKRIVTCVNACAGITNPEAIPEVLEAVELMIIHINKIYPGLAISDLMHELKEALAKLEGNQ